MESKPDDEWEVQDEPGGVCVSDNQRSRMTLWRTPSAVRQVDRPVDSGFRASTRPRNDAGYRELSRRLLAYVGSDDGEEKRRKVRKHPSVNRLVAQREMGRLRTSCSFGRNALRALILSKNRSYVLSETHDAKGFLNVEGNLLVAHKARKIYNIDIAEPLCALDMLAESDKIQSTLWIELAVDLQEGPSNSSPYWMIILTQSRLLCIDPMRHSVKAEFLLPSEYCKFGCLAPNELGRTFCLFGQMLPQGRERGSVVATDSVVGIFDIYPLKFKGLFRVTNQVFGNVTNVSVISDMVIVFKKKPYETVLYNLADFQNHTEEGLYDAEIWLNGKAVLPSPTVIISEPDKCARIMGNWTTLEYSGVPYHLLGVPWYSRGSYMLVDAAKLSEPTALPFSLKPSKNTSLIVEGDSIQFHSDESGRILRFDGPAIVSYNMQRSAKGEVSFQEVWRTNLWVLDSFFRKRLGSEVKVKSSFGRHIKLTPDLEHDYRLVIKGVEIDIDCQIIAVIAECDIHSPIFDDPCRPFDAITRRNVYMEEVDMCTVIFLLDDATGAIVKTAMMREPLRENTTLHFDMSGVLMCFNQRGHRKSFLEVQRLQEMGVVEWERPVRNQVNTIARNGRQTRLSTRNAAREGSSSTMAPYAAYLGNSRRSLSRMDDFGPSTSLATESAQRRLRRLRIVYFDDDDSSDSDYRPDSR